MKTALFFILILNSCFAYTTPYANLVDRAAYDNNAAYKLAIDYLLGEHGEQNLTKAYQWIVKADEKGYLPATVTRAKMCINGVIEEQDYNKAFWLYYKAARRGHLDARAKVGFFYLNGIGVKRSYAKAEHWLKMAANAQHLEAMQNLGYLYATAPEPYFHPSLAISYLKPLAKMGNKKAIFHLGLLYQTPYTTTASLDLAKRYLERAVWLDVASAQCPLYRVYQAFGIKKNEQSLLNEKKFKPIYCD